MVTSLAWKQRFGMLVTGTVAPLAACGTSRLLARCWLAAPRSWVCRGDADADSDDDYDDYDDCVEDDDYDDYDDDDDDDDDGDDDDDDDDDDDEEEEEDDEDVVDEGSMTSPGYTSVAKVLRYARQGGRSTTAAAAGRGRIRTVGI